MKTHSRHSKGRQAKPKQSVVKTPLAQCHAVVIGAGAIGRAVAILLASLGVRHMSLYDPAIVTRKNLVQGFMDFDVGLAKVDAVANIAHQQNPHMELLTYRSRFRRFHLKQWQSGVRNAIFLCLDSLATRKSIWNGVKRSVQFLCAARLGPDVIRLLANTKPATDKCYTTTLVPGDTKLCSSDLVMANLVACLMVIQFKRWIRDQSISYDQIFNPLPQEIVILVEEK